MNDEWNADWLLNDLIQPFPELFRDEDEKKKVMMNHEPLVRILDGDVRLSTCVGDLKITDDFKPYYCLNLAVDFEGLLDFRALNGEEALERQLGAELIKVITDRKVEAHDVGKMGADAQAPAAGQADG